MTAYSRKWLERHCEENETLIYFFEITCAYCNKVFKKSDKNYIRKFIKHLHHHGLTELDGHSRCKELKEKFEIMQNYVGICKKQKCKLQIIFVRGVHLLQNHLEIYHGKRSNIYKNVIRQNMRAQHILLNNFFITSNNTAQCLICKFEESLSNLELQTEETLETLKEHWAGHFQKIELDEIYRLEQLQQRIDENNLLSDDAGEMRNYFEFTSEEIENFDELIEEAIDYEQHIEILTTFKIFKINSERICTYCLRTVTTDGHYYIERNHWELYHGLFAQIYEEILDIEMVHDIFNHYVIMNYMLRCLYCTHVFEVKALRLNVEEQLVILLKHCNTHIGISLDYEIDQEEHLRKEFKRKLNTEKELVEVENSRRDDHGQQSSDCDNTSTDAITEPSEQSGSNISIDAGTDCKYMVNFALPSRQSGERQSTSVQSPSESDISKSPPAKQKKK
ncbi:PREDICTED: uncharacterized protein LOC108750738 [Trachymyrmex septentrionalis]|uniref:uncharacterized protein LOC108750738 n=1 Tax=Trachymyrmex septentrionalis TaxID=34720 RepID=UPI00084F5D53|nr:PREDICTED: uncharacterized protein LOC108750738 [Trachymyrmex septentrionalis]